MKRRMKWIATVLCLSVFAAMALGSGQSDSDETRQIVSDEEQEKTDDDESVSDDSGDSVDSSDAVVTIDEQVLVDQDGIVVTATEYVTDSIWGDGVKLLLENNSDRDVTVGCNALIVNDYMITDLFSSEIAAGKKSIDDITVFSSDLEENGIKAIEEVELKFHIYDADSYSTIADSEPITFTAQ